MQISLEEVHLKAGLAICSLAQKTEQRGRKNADELKTSKGWIESAFGGSFVNVKKFLEAAEYYEIASNVIIDEANKSFAMYQKGLLLEEIGETSKAIDAYNAVNLDNEAYGSCVAMALTRCRAAESGNPMDFTNPTTIVAMMHAMMPELADEMAQAMANATQTQSSKIGP